MKQIFALFALLALVNSTSFAAPIKIKWPWEFKFESKIRTESGIKEKYKWVPAHEIIRQQKQSSRSVKSLQGKTSEIFENSSAMKQLFDETCRMASFGKTPDNYLIIGSYYKKNRFPFKPYRRAINHTSNAKSYLQKKLGADWEINENATRITEKNRKSERKINSLESFYRHDLADARICVHIDPINSDISVTVAGKLKKGNIPVEFEVTSKKKMKLAALIHKGGVHSFSICHEYDLNRAIEAEKDISAEISADICFPLEKSTINFKRGNKTYMIGPTDWTFEFAL